jgi:hypothetical protein
VKIDVTYEKADILALVMKALQGRGLKLKPGTSLAYKGALEVKLSVEVVDDAEDVVSPSSTPATPRLAARSSLPPSDDTSDDPPPVVDLADVLASSRNLEKTTEGKFTRPLADGPYMKETREWPGPPPEDD